MSEMTMRVVTLAAVLGGALAYSPARPLYEFDSTWRPQFPEGSHTLSGVGITHSFAIPAAGSPPPSSIVYITQRGNVSVAPVLVLNGTTGALIRSWGQDGVAIDKTTAPSKPTWGSHGVAVETCRWPCVSKDGEIADHRVYIEDFTGHTVRSYSPTGKLLLSLGTPGVAGNGTSPLQFGNVADAALVTGVVAPGGEVSETLLYATDGDGGSANRVVKLAIAATGDEAEVKWVTPNNPRRYNNPHSITLHPPSGLLIVADREQQELKLVRSSDGADLGVLDCGLNFGKEGASQHNRPGCRNALLANPRPAWRLPHTLFTIVILRVRRSAVRGTHASDGVTRPPVRREHGQPAGRQVPEDLGASRHDTLAAPEDLAVRRRTALLMMGAC